MNTRRRPEYQAWLAMKGRCLNTRHEAFKNYGGRGIRICPEWIDSFLVFLEDMGERTSAKHSLDRIDNDGNYEPGNCRWATRVQQNSNTRRRAKSGCIGVYPASRGRGWQAVAELDGRTFHVGYFASAEVAARARDAFVVERQLRRGEAQ